MNESCMFSSKLGVNYRSAKTYAFAIITSQIDTCSILLYAIKSHADIIAKTPVIEESNEDVHQEIMSGVARSINSLISQQNLRDATYY